MEPKKLAEERLPRIKDFCGKKRGALINVTEIASLKTLPFKPLSAWNFPSELYQYLDTIIEAAELHWSQRGEVHDDLLPAVCPWFGIAEHSAIVAGEIHFTERTSFQVPYITSWEKLGSISLSGDNKWFKILMDSFVYLKEKTEGRFMLKQRGGAGPMDMANALRGNEIFSDFYDCPDEVHKLLALCVKAIDWSFENQMKIIGKNENDGGFISYYSAWMPGKSAGHFSEDASVMCSVPMYNEFGRPYTEKFCAGYDNTMVHLHGAGKHAFAEILSVPNCNFVELTNDPKHSRGMELLKEFEPLFEGKTVVLHLNRDEFDANREFLKTKKVIIDYAAVSVEDAVSMVKAVRSL